MNTRASSVLTSLALAGVIVCSFPTWGKAALTPPGNLAGTTGTQAADARNSPITLNLTNTPVRAAIDALFKFVPFNHVIGSDVDGMVTVSLDKVPFEQALRAICQINDPPLSFRREEGIYSITVKQKPTETATVATPPTATQPTDQTQTDQSESRVHKIQLNFASAADVGAIFGAQAPPSRANQFTMGGMMGGGYGGGMMGGGYGGFGGGMMGGGYGGFGGGMMGGGYGGFGGGMMGGGYGGFGGGMMGGGYGGFGGGGYGGYGGGYRTF